jgi:hypothetical protein
MMAPLYIVGLDILQEQQKHGQHSNAETGTLGISTTQRRSLTQMGYGATLSHPGGSLVLQEKL